MKYILFTSAYLLLSAAVGQVGAAKCSGYKSCDGATGPIGEDSCTENFACAESQSSIGSGSCNAVSGCYQSKSAIIGNNSCNVGNACNNCQFSVPDDKCNDRYDTDDFETFNSACKYCIADYVSDTPASISGDPHVKTWSAKDYSVHGQCQNTMAKSEKFFNGKGLVVQIRTTRIDRPHGKSYSYISGAAVKVGDDVVEVQDDGSAIINGVNDLLAATKSFDGFLLSKSIKGKHDNIYVYDLSYDNGAAIQIRANLKTGIVNVDLSGSYPEDMMGLLGSQHHSKLLARDGETDLTGMYNTFFNEWQVRDDEPQLFINEDYVPLYPQPCLYKEVKKSNVRRRLSDVEPVSIEAAEEACAGALPDKKQYCIDDVTATGDLELAEDRFYTGIMV